MTIRTQEEKNLICREMARKAMKSPDLLIDTGSQLRELAVEGAATWHESPDQIYYDDAIYELVDDFKIHNMGHWTGYNLVEKIDPVLINTALGEG